ncbi:MAG: DMT family transporter [Deltaproteobacteria bacterium]|nr:DMT family transporter [Deltaproteobacteria bacterium]
MVAPTIAAAASAVLFGSGAPACKALLGAIDPRWLAGLLYLGSAAALGAALLARGRKAWGSTGLRRGDLRWLAGAIVVGGVIAPLLALWGLSRTTAASASLLLALEAPLTALWARWLFGEHLGARTIQGLALITLAAAATAAPAGGGAVDAWGCLAVTLACACWALDNNMTREVAHADATTIAAIKGLVGGLLNASLAAVTAPAPAAPLALGAALVGALAYGASLVLYIVALRGLGAARASAYFAAAPLVGALVGVAVLGEPATTRLLFAGLLVLGGVQRLAWEPHYHRHRHAAFEHFHPHVHDAHHHHAHRGGEGVEPHAHQHPHEPLEHEHAHAPDLHHRHGHE